MDFSVFLYNMPIICPSKIVYLAQHGHLEGTVLSDAHTLRSLNLSRIRNVLGIPKAQ